MFSSQYVKISIRSNVFSVAEPNFAATCTGVFATDIGKLISIFRSFYLLLRVKFVYFCVFCCCCRRRLLCIIIICVLSGMNSGAHIVNMFKTYICYMERGLFQSANATASE